MQKCRDEKKADEISLDYIVVYRFIDFVFILLCIQMPD